MRKVFLILSAIIATATVSFAQQGKNQLGIGPELGVSTATGGGTAFGGSAKYMHGVGTAGQITFMVGLMLDSETEESGGSTYKASGSDLSLLLGYRHYFGGLFLEPQAGLIRSSITAKVDGQEVGKASLSSFGYAIGTGYALKNGVDLGVGFRNIARSGAQGIIVFRVAYNIPLSDSSD